MSKDDATPIRTILFVPGSEQEEVLRAAGHGADAIVFDLEEPRTPYPESEREATRQRMRTFFDGAAGQAGSPRWFVRVQPPDTGQTLKDLRAVMGPHLAGILLPKVYGPEDVYRLESLLTCLEVEFDLPLGATVVYPILETAQSLRLAYDIATASPRVQYMGGAVSRFGDIHQALGYRWTEEGRETLFLRAKVLVDARAAGIRYPISGMWGGATDDTDGLGQRAARSRLLRHDAGRSGPRGHGQRHLQPERRGHRLLAGPRASGGRGGGAGPRSGALRGSESGRGPRGPPGPCRFGPQEFGLGERSRPSGLSTTETGHEGEDWLHD
jgi:citrate lyase subunit beta/citryl-CoA lyase